MSLIKLSERDCISEQTVFFSEQVGPGIEDQEEEETEEEAVTQPQKEEQELLEKVKQEVEEEKKVRADKKF